MAKNLEVRSPEVETDTNEDECIVIYRRGHPTPRDWSSKVRDAWPRKPQPWVKAGRVLQYSYQYVNQKTWT